MRNYVENGTIKINFLRSEDNDTDVFTKNAIEYVQQTHQEIHDWEFNLLEGIRE